MLQSIHSFFLFCLHYSLFLPSRTSRILFWSLPLLRGSVITGNR
ncbi:hypothetical protein ES319_A10G000100v1 [Gossypium barbadense]|uniref:Uncharacterized protein n=1 Tax=Gossypium barbadense TaxID=3634 RepID=A0A5J5TXF0_GOSBA|nr:hypothetical protein ES319_A10G000100v1 [Gossypium barbadense]